MKQLILFPFNGNAREALGVVEAINQRAPTWEVLGFIDDDPARANDVMGDLRVLGGRDVLAMPLGCPTNAWRRSCIPWQR